MSKQLFCPNCETVGNPKVKNKGSGFVLIFLFLFFIIPGLFYLVYMLSGRIYSCKVCGQAGMIATD